MSGTGRTLIGVRFDKSSFEKSMDIFVKSTGASLVTLHTDGIYFGEDGTGVDQTWYGDTASAYMKWDQSEDDWILSGAASVQTAQTGTGYSLNLISVTSTTASGNTRGWRVNVTTSDSITHGDLQCVHGYLTMGTSNTLATNAAVYPLSAWIDLPSDLTTGTGNLIAGLRVIFDANGLDLSSLAGGGESALIYAQKWSDSGGDLEHGLRVVCGGGTGSIKNAISVASTGSATLGRFLDWTEGPAGFQEFATLPTADAQSRHLVIYMGDSATNAAVFAEVSATAGKGSLYISSEGQLYIRVNNGGTEADWQVVDSSDN